MGRRNRCAQFLADTKAFQIEDNQTRLFARRTDSGWGALPLPITPNGRTIVRQISSPKDVIGASVTEANCIVEEKSICFVKMSLPFSEERLTRAILFKNKTKLESAYAEKLSTKYGKQVRTFKNIRQCLYRRQS